MNKVLMMLALGVILLVPNAAGAQQGTYGPYSALSIDKAVVDDVVVEGKDLYVKINKDYWDGEFIVKASANEKELYVDWANGTKEMPVKVYKSQAKDKQGYTYRISTSAPFVEYWTGSRLVLHLRKAQ